MYLRTPNPCQGSVCPTKVQKLPRHAMAVSPSPSSNKSALFIFPAGVWAYHASEQNFWLAHSLYKRRQVHETWRLQGFKVHFCRCNCSRGWWPWWFSRGATPNYYNVILCIRDLYWPRSLRRLANSHLGLGLAASIILTGCEDWGFLWLEERFRVIKLVTATACPKSKWGRSWSLSLGYVCIVHGHDLSHKLSSVAIGVAMRFGSE